MHSDGAGSTLRRRSGSGSEVESLEDLEDVARLYRDEAARVRRLVRRHVNAPVPVIEDACQIAWCRLLIHRSRLRRQTAAAWLVRVAINEALRSMQRQRREQSLDALVEREAPGETPRAMQRAATPSLVEELAEQRARLASVEGLPDRQRKLMWLQGLGLSYREMAGETGMSRRTVERQLMRARVSLVELAAESLVTFPGGSGVRQTPSDTVPETSTNSSTTATSSPVANDWMCARSEVTPASAVAETSSVPRSPSTLWARLTTGGAAASATTGATTDATSAPRVASSKPDLLRIFPPTRSATW